MVSLIIALTSTSEEVSVKIENEIIKNSLQEKLLGIVIDNRRILEPDVENLCRKAGQKLHAIARIANYTDISKKSHCSIMNAFTLSQFSYGPLTWMFRSRKFNHRINKRTLRIVYSDLQCTIKELLERDNFFYDSRKKLPETSH